MRHMLHALYAMALATAPEMPLVVHVHVTLAAETRILPSTPIANPDAKINAMTRTLAKYPPESPNGLDDVPHNA